MDPFSQDDLEALFSGDIFDFDTLEPQNNIEDKLCNHKFIPLYSSISCIYCGLDQRDLKKKT